MPSNHLNLCHPLLLLPSIFPSIKVFSNDSVLSIRWPKYWSFSFSISPSNEHLGLISFRMDWLDLLVVHSSVQFSSVAQSCLTLCDPMNRSMPGLPVNHQLLEPTQTYVHRVGVAIQPSHSLSSPSPPALNLSQHQGLFKWVSFSHEVAKVFVSVSTSVPPMNTQDWSPLGWTGWTSLQSKERSRVLSNTTVWKHQFFGAQPSL